MVAGGGGGGGGWGGGCSSEHFPTRLLAGACRGIMWGEACGVFLWENGDVWDGKSCGI